MELQNDGNAHIIKDDFEQLSNFSIDLESEKSPFFSLINLIYNNSMLAMEFGSEEGVSDDEFRISIENAFSNSQIQNYLSEEVKSQKRNYPKFCFC